MYPPSNLILSFLSLLTAQRTDPLSPTEQVCITSSSLPSLTGTYKHSSFDSTTNGAIFHNTQSNYYLYPWIFAEKNKDYLVSTDPTQTVAVSRCDIPSDRFQNILNPDDCFNHWSPADVSSVNCNDICISGSVHDFLDGVYEWHHFNTTTHSSTYQCKECIVTAYLFGYIYTDNNGIHHNWRIGPNYPHPAAWSSCWIDTNDTNYKFDLNDCIGWDDAVRFQWVDSNIVANKCIYTTMGPSINPTMFPVISPSISPIKNPTKVPTNDPTMKPSFNPTMIPTDLPTQTPTLRPSNIPSTTPTNDPVLNPTNNPTKLPTIQPSPVPTSKPFHPPTLKPSHDPTIRPSNIPTRKPSDSPTRYPSSVPTVTPSQRPTLNPSDAPTHNPSQDPTLKPSRSPNLDPSHTPTWKPSYTPSNTPTAYPSHDPTPVPSSSPTLTPTSKPTAFVSISPTITPTNTITTSKTTTNIPTISTSTIQNPTNIPTINPTLYPTKHPTLVIKPFAFPTHKPTLLPTPPLIYGPDDESNSAEQPSPSTTDPSDTIGLTTNVVILSHASINDEWVSFSVSHADLSCGGKIDAVHILDTALNRKGWIRSSRKTDEWYEFDALNTSFILPISIQMIRNKEEILIGNDIIDSWNGERAYDFGDNFCKSSNDRRIVFRYEIDAVDAAFHYFVIAICLVFIIFGFVVFIDGKCFNRNDYFKASFVVSSLIQILCMMSYLFFINDVWGHLHASDGLILILALSILCILCPIVISFGYLFKEKASKYWLFNERIREWMHRYTGLLYFYSIITGSSFTAIEIFNSNIFGLDLFFMGIPQQFIHKFMLKKIFVIIVCSNCTQLTLIVFYAVIMGRLNPVPMISIAFSLLSIIITSSMLLLNKRIYSSRDYIYITMDVTGPCMFDNRKLSTNRIKSAKKYLCRSVWKLNEDRVQFMRPYYGSCKNGLQIQIHISCSNAVNPSQIIQFEDSLNDVIDNNKLAKIMKKEWRLSSLPNIANISSQFVSSNTMKEMNVNEAVVTEEDDDDDEDQYMHSSIDTQSKQSDNNSEILGLWKAITNIDAMDGSELETYTAQELETYNTH